MKEKFLFVGGKADGQILEVPSGYSYYQVPFVGSYDRESSDELCAATIEKETYRKMLWKSGDNTTFSIFVFEKL